MKKTLLKGMALAFVGSLFMAGSAMALSLTTTSNIRPIDPVPDGWGTEPSVQTILDSYGTGLDAEDDQTGVALWTQHDINIGVPTTTLFELEYNTAYSQLTNLGIWDYVSGEEYAFFSSATSVTQATFGFQGGNLYDGSAGLLDIGGWSGAFGVFWTIDGSTSYSLDEMNGGTARMLSYGLPLGILGSDGSGDDWLLFFDNPSSAIDFNDAVAVLKDAAPVPEPATMLLFGTGLAGLAGLKRRRAKKA